MEEKLDPCLRLKIQRYRYISDVNLTEDAMETMKKREIERCSSDKRLKDGGKASVLLDINKIHLHGMICSLSPYLIPERHL